MELIEVLQLEENLNMNKMEIIKNVQLENIESEEHQLYEMLVNLCQQLDLKNME